MKMLCVLLLATVALAQENNERPSPYTDVTEDAIWANDLAKICRPLDRSLDLLFVLDGSGSVAGDVFDTQMKMVNRVIDLIEIGPNSTRMAMMQYSGWTRVEFQFDEHMTKSSLREAVEEVGHFSGSTRTGRGLDKALKMFSSQYGARMGRDDVAQVAVVVSDGRSIDDPRPAADRLRRQGVTVMTMGIGYNVFQPELQKIAGSASLAFVNETMDEFLQAFKKIAIGEQCDYAKGPRGAEILCEADSVQVNVKTNLPLHGHLYVAGFFDDEECRAMAKRESSDADLRRIASLTVPLDRCGVQKQFLFSPRGLLFETTVILKYHPDYNSIVDQVFSVRCFYPDMEKDQLHSESEISDGEFSLDEAVVHQPRIASFSAPEMLMPCAYKVTRDESNSCLIDMVRVGASITHKWQCDRDIFGTSYRILVHSCAMKNEKGHERLIIDEHGCSIDPHLIATPTYDSDLNAHVQGVASKFAESAMVKYKCAISFCRKDSGECDEMLPPRCSAEEKEARRSKRQIVRTDLHNGVPSHMLDKLFARRNFFFNPAATRAATLPTQATPTTSVTSEEEPAATESTEAPFAAEAAETAEDDEKFGMELEIPAEVREAMRARQRAQQAASSTQEPEEDKSASGEFITLRPTAPPEPAASREEVLRTLNQLGVSRTNVHLSSNRVRLAQASDAVASASEATTTTALPTTTSKAKAQASSVQFAIDSPTITLVEGSGEETIAKPSKDDMHLMGLSEMIVRHIDFSQVELESQMVQVHDLMDTRMTGHSPVNWCPRETIY